MKNKILIVLRVVLFSPFHLFIWLSKFYSKFLSFIDPNGSECYWEELSQKHINGRINSKLNLKNEIEYTSNKFDYNKGLNFYTPTKVSSFRAKSLFFKERDTLEWIDKFGDNKKVFFDIGANVGTYSLYYCSIYNSKIYSFEPSYRNLDLLIKNINLNNLSKNISVISNPVYDKETINSFNQKENIAGNAGATFSEKNLFGLNFKTLGLSIDYLVTNNIIEKPNLIKIDVDGNELEVLKGAKKTILDKSCETILVETRGSTKNLIETILKESGYVHKLNKSSQDINNEIWLRG